MSKSVPYIVLQICNPDGKGLPTEPFLHTSFIGIMALKLQSVGSTGEETGSPHSLSAPLTENRTELGS